MDTNQLNFLAEPTFSLKEFIRTNKVIKFYLIVSILASIFQFGLFKYYYPFPNFIHGDSFVYILLAQNNPKIGTYPIGYPMFLRLFSVFSKSDSVLVFFQYFLLQISLLYFLFSIFLFIKLRRITQVLMLIFFIINPVSWYLANLISSDALFLALSIIWFTQIIWILYKPSNRIVYANAIILVVLFMVRYNALYYPIITLLTVFLVKRFFMRRLLGVFLSSIMIMLFVRYTANDYKRLSGIYQFSPFSGWQLANNALYAYRYVDSSKIRQLPKKFEGIDRMVRNYFDSTRDLKRFPSEGLIASTVYMWAPNSPLNLYADSIVHNDSTVGPLKRWSIAAPMMKAYGSQLIMTYPSEFIKYYIVPNGIKYYAPPVEFLEYYNDRRDSIAEIAKVWFNLKSIKVHSRFKDYEVKTLSYYPILVAMIHVILVLNIISFFLLGFGKRFPEIARYLWICLFVWSINFGFSVFASPIALRFQLFPIFVSTSLSFVLMEYLISIAFNNSDKKILENGKASKELELC